MYLIIFTFDTKILQSWQIFVPIHPFVDINLAIEKSYPRRKNGVLRIRPELNLALSDNPASRVIFHMSCVTCLLGPYDIKYI